MKIGILWECSSGRWGCIRHIEPRTNNSRKQNLKILNLNFVLVSNVSQDNLHFPLLRTLKVISYMLKYFSNFVLGEPNTMISTFFFFFFFRKTFISVQGFSAILLVFSLERFWYLSRASFWSFSLFFLVIFINHFFMCLQIKLLKKLLVIQKISEKYFL